MTIPDFLEQDPDGTIRLHGHRIELWQVLHYYREGQAPEMLAYQYPTLGLALIHKVIAFYWENRSEAEAYLAASQSEIDRQRAASPRHINVAELQSRLAPLKP